MAAVFFENGIPDNLTVNGGKASIEREQRKQGACSLRWEFNSGDRLTFETDIGYKEITDSDINALKYAFGMYLYDFMSEASLRIEFFKRGRVSVWFDIILGFNGWRSVRSRFDCDMTGVAEAGMDMLVITANGSGCVLLDEIVTANRIDCRFFAATPQQPYIAEEYVPDKVKRAIKKEYQTPDIYGDDVRIVGERIRRYILDEFGGGDEDAGDLLAQADELCICEGKIGLTGKRVEYSMQRRIVKDLDGEDEPYIELGHVTSLMLRMAAAHGLTGDERIKSRYILILRYLISCGLAEGSTLGGLHCLDYTLKPLHLSAMLMGDAIREAGLAETFYRLQSWFLRMDYWGFFEGQDWEQPSADDFNNMSVGILIVILFLDDSERASRLKAYSAWMSNGMKYTGGLGALLKEDGCIFHHGGHYLAYGSGALCGIAPVVYALTGTEFEICSQARLNLTNALLSARFQCNARDYPIVFTGRHPWDSCWKLPLIPFKYFALSGLQNGSGEMAAAYLRLVSDSEEKPDARLADAGIKAEKNPAGNRTFNMACANIHRRDDWMAVAKGFSKYLWGNETYEQNNIYGRYRSYGAVEILHKSTVRESWYCHDGFDWNRFPGTTAIYTPFEELRSRIYCLDDKSGFEEMLISDQSFAGGNTLGENGMFSMILKEHPKYNGTHTAHKSVFFIGDFILLTGSNISNVSGYETETTLYQNHLPDGEGAPLLNGRPYRGTHTVRDGDIIADNKGHHYYVKPGTKVCMGDGAQSSPSSTGDGVREGSHAFGVIKHGTSPANASYEYGIGINGAEGPEYEVIRQDDTAHVVKFGSLTCMAIFAPEKFETVRTCVPLMVMMEQTAACVTLAVCDPDLGFYDRDPAQYSKDGTRLEVSIYSRAWFNNPLRERNIKASMPELGIEIDVTLKGGQITVLSVPVENIKRSGGEI